MGANGSFIMGKDFILRMQLAALSLSAPAFYCMEN